MRPISPRVRKLIDSDPFYTKCCITGEPNPSMEHCWLYAGKQIDEAWAIVPLAYRFNTSHPPKDIKEKCQLISLGRATQEDLSKYPRKDWITMKSYLEKKFDII